MKQILSSIRKAVEDYNMIEEGDKIAVALSGGKDSLALLLALNNLKRFYPKHFEIMALTIDPGSNVFDTTELEGILKRVEFTKIEVYSFDDVTKGENLPILTSCCPGWINFIESQFPDMLNLPSSCKSPQQMFGAIAKSYYAQKIGKDAKDMVVVSIMPCLAKKYECSRDELAVNNIADVDYSLSTRELAKMLKSAGIDLNDMPEDSFEDPMGESTGAADIFASSGGVLEAALRTAYEKITGKTLDCVDFKEVRGLEGTKEATVKVGDLELNVAVVSGLGNARKILEKIKNGEANYHAVEVMACPGGCINGGGQPYHHGNSEIITKRMEAIYAEDAGKAVRKSHENESIKTLYKEFLGEPLGHKSHELLHTHYKAK
jgi:iron only hydrogenase large subunit-like protein